MVVNIVQGFAKYILLPPTKQLDGCGVNKSCSALAIQSVYAFSSCAQYQVVFCFQPLELCLCIVCTCVIR